MAPSNEPFEVIIIDGGSKDKTVEIAQKYPVKVLTCNGRGIGPARNMGLREARGEVVCYTDSDCIAESMWLRKISSFFRKNPEVDGVGGLVLWYSEKATKLQRLSGEIFVKSQSFPKHKTKTRAGSFYGVLMDANSAYKRRVLIETGGFPEPVGLGHELSWKLVKRGKTLVFDPNLRVFHIFPGTLRGLFRQQFRWGMYISVLERKYRLTYKGLAYLPYLIVKTFLRLFDFQHLSLRILSFCQLLFWCVGRFYALQFQDFYQIPRKAIE
jgi:cellulose synthase/poly-beta-1,6-N-acetylglucosamine synthase-like glycosyltransferase